MNLVTSISTAGDVNGDGYDDLIVGAYSYSILGTHNGKAYIYFGGASLNNTADITLTCAAAYDEFGHSVSTAGDVNGDGYADVIVGASGDNSKTGRAYIYFGGVSMDNTADLILTGVTAFDAFGSSVSTAGDVNGDGYSDVIVAASGFLDDWGRVYIYLGGISMDDVADVLITGEQNDRLGTTISKAGDINGDGYDDIMVLSSFDLGYVNIYFGGSSMNNTADVILNDGYAGDAFGYSFSTAGDVNGDGYSDVIVGAKNSDVGGTDAGRAYIYFGSSLMSGIADVTLTGFIAGSLFGHSVSTAGDVNGDGFDDVVVGGYDDLNFIPSAFVLIYFGGKSMDNTIDIVFKSDEVGQGFGRAVSSAGDVNADGLSDVVVGSPANDAGGTECWKSLPLYFNCTNNSTAHYIY